MLKELFFELSFLYSSFTPWTVLQELVKEALDQPPEMAMDARIRFGTSVIFIVAGNDGATLRFDGGGEWAEFYFILAGTEVRLHSCKWNEGNWQSSRLEEIDKNFSEWFYKEEIAQVG